MTWQARLDDARALYAKMITASCIRCTDRLEDAFELVPREAFLPPGPWKLFAGSGRYIETPTSDPIHLYQNVLIALDADVGLNTGSPHLHALWLDAVIPDRGERIVHIGAGTGYYSAILSLLVLPDGWVDAFEIRKDLAETAARNLAPFENVSLHRADASSLELPQADIIYVNASVTEPPLQWLKALRPGGRMIFPWQPSRNVGITALITSRGSGYQFEPLMQSRFIQCVGASESFSDLPGLDNEAARNIRSVHVRADQNPDETSIAAFEHIWFSSRKLAA